MLVESLELTMSHVGLGNLNEYALMVLFGNAHSHQLTYGLSNNPSEITSVDGEVLYPAYFMTQLKVPLSHLLPSFKLWEQVDIGVDVQRFGETLLQSTYIIGRQDSIQDDVNTWANADLPTMVGNNLIVAEQMNGQTAGI